MNAKKILLATDLTETSRAAESLATSLAETCGARLIVVYVTPGQPTANLGPLYGSLPDPQIPPLARQLAAIKPAEGNAQCEHRILVGDPASEILKVAAEEQADLIILGTHGRSATKRLLLGNVAERVLTHAAEGVVVCKGPAR